MFWRFKSLQVQVGTGRKCAYTLDVYAYVHAVHICACMIECSFGEHTHSEPLLFSGSTPTWHLFSLSEPSMSQRVHTRVVRSFSAGLHPRGIPRLCIGLQAACFALTVDVWSLWVPSGQPPVGFYQRSLHVAMYDLCGIYVSQFLCASIL